MSSIYHSHMNVDLWDKYEEHLLNEGITKKRRNKLRQMFRTSSRGLNKDFNKVTREDIEEFVNGLHRNTFTRRDGELFSGSSKSDIKKFLKQFYKWLKGKNEYYPPEVAWLRTKIAKDEKPKQKPVISLFEIKELASKFLKIDLRILTLLLYDSGFRISEMLSVKKKDLTWDNYEQGKKCFWLKCNESKTELRNVPIPLFTDAIREFKNSAYYKNLKDDDALFDTSYSNYVKYLKIHSKKLLKKVISPHCLRHSSATYYAKKLDGNIMAICQRYGWGFNSDEAAGYIRRSGAYHKVAAKKIFETEIEKIKEENQDLKKRVEAIEHWIEIKKKIKKR